MTEQEAFKTFMANRSYTTTFYEETLMYEAWDAALKFSKDRVDTLKMEVLELRRQHRSTIT